MEQIDIKNLEEAIVLFYRSTSQEQAATHEWLTKAQASPQAWSFTWELMSPGKRQEVQFFGAVTLHSKLMKFWHEVPPENREELKQKLLESIITFSNGPKLVLNRLCIALSAYIVHMIGEWPTAVEDVINTFQVQQIPNVSTEMQLWIMFEILQAIPEEADAIFTSVKRVTLRGELAKKVPVVIATIQQYLEHLLDSEWSDDDYGNMIRAAKCAGLWIKNIGYQIDCCQKICEVLVQVVSKTYWTSIQTGDGCLSSEENDLAEACIKTLVNIMIQHESHYYPKVAFAIINMFLDSFTPITKAEWKENNNNEDIVVNIYTLLISSIERHSQLLLTGFLTNDDAHVNLFGRMIGEIILCTDKPGIYPVEESCSNLAMGFWYMLQDEVFSLQSTDDKNKCWANIKPVYSLLTRILIKKAQQPDETAIEKWTPDDLETFRCYRQDISDTLMYCYDVLHNQVLDILASVLNETIIEMQTNPTKWTQLEACIYAFYSVAEHIDTIENNQIPKLMRVLAGIPYETLNDKLLGTALEAVGAYCLWFKENPDYIPSAIELLVKGLNSSMSSQATLGLKDLCRDCQLQMRPYAEPLLNACQASLTGGRLRNSDSVRLMFSIGKLMSMLPSVKIPSYLDIIVSPCFEELQYICQAGVKTQAAQIRTVFRLNMISTLFSSLNTDLEDAEHLDIVSNVQPVLLVMQKTMPTFRQIAELWIEQNEVIETACSALKHAITNLKSDFRPMLEDFCYFIISILQAKICPPALDVSKTCIIIFYKTENSKDLMQQLLIELILYNFRLFEQTPQDGFSNIADIIETFYACQGHIIKKLPMALANPNIDLNKLILYALKSVTLPENGPIKNSIQFLSHFIMQSRQYPNMTQVMLEKGEDIVRTSLMCVGCTTPKAQVEKFADIFLSINKKYPSELVTWMKILGTPNFPTHLISEADKMKLMSQIIREKVNKRLIQTYLNEFAAKSRGLLEKV